MKSGPIRGISIFLLFKSFTSLNCCLCHCILVWSIPPPSGAVYNTILYRIVIRLLCYYSFIETFPKETQQNFSDYKNFMIQKTKVYSRVERLNPTLTFLWHLWKKLFNLLLIPWFSLQNNCIGNWCYNNNSGFLFLLHSAAGTYNIHLYFLEYPN